MTSAESCCLEQTSETKEEHSVRSERTRGSVLELCAAVDVTSEPTDFWLKHAGEWGGGGGGGGLFRQIHRGLVKTQWFASDAQAVFEL